MTAFVCSDAGRQTHGVGVFKLHIFQGALILFVFIVFFNVGHEIRCFIETALFYEHYFRNDNSPFYDFMNGNLTGDGVLICEYQHVVRKMVLYSLV